MTRVSRCILSHVVVTRRRETHREPSKSGEARCCRASMGDRRAQAIAFDAMNVVRCSLPPANALHKLWNLGTVALKQLQAHGAHEQTQTCTSEWEGRASSDGE